MKWFLLIIATIVIIAIANGYKGGASSAAGNYNTLLRGSGVSK
ncbi:MAG: hypothetical protein WC141_00655 [Arcobacteraceae bacterium]